MAFMSVDMLIVAQTIRANGCNHLFSTNKIVKGTFWFSVFCLRIRDFVLIR